MWRGRVAWRWWGSSRSRSGGRNRALGVSSRNPITGRPYSERMTHRIRKIAIASALLALIAGATALAVVWAPDRSVAELSARWAPPPSTFIRVGAHTLHLRDEGPRDSLPPIVLLHGTSASLHTWDGWVDSLISTRRVVRFDLPGFGLTGPAPDDDYRIISYARLVVAVLDSLGGEIAARVGSLAPERVAALILVDPAGFPIDYVSIPIGFKLARNPITAPLLKHVLPRGVVRSSVENVYGDPTRVTDALVDRYFELTLRAGNRAALPIRFAQESKGADTAFFAAITAPTLILWGEKDRLIPPEHGARWLRAVKGSELVRYPQLGHVPHEEGPAETLRDARKFLAR
jgi:pimeloyl-ACP methyl ester carboxylesterase